MGQAKILYVDIDEKNDLVSMTMENLSIKWDAYFREYAVNCFFSLK